MAIAVEMPKMSDTMEEGLLVAWLVDEGAKVKSGDVVAQVETDKATMDLEVYDDGVLLKRLIGEGESVPIGGLIAILGKENEDFSAILAKYGKAEGASPEVAMPVESAPPVLVPGPVVGEDGRIKASPLARKMAEEKGVSLSGIAGSGPEGRIVKRDVENVEPVAIPVVVPAPIPASVSAPKPTPVAPTPAPKPTMAIGGGHKSLKITPMRRTIARRLAESKFTAPHFYLQVEADMERAIAFRSEMNKLAESRKLSKISFNDLVTKACAVALRNHPMVNASYLESEGEIRLYDHVHVAIAVAVDEGLVTPVIRNADQKGLSQIAAETQELAGRARARTLEPADWEGSTFTTSNLGMFGIERFTAIINPPNAAILAIGTIRDVPVVKDSAIVPGKRMALSLSCDHRVVDGAVGAAFLSEVKQYLEEPNLLLL
ncbi:MAG: 2-oxo acid dehydrogenase subunit E2 [Bacteroidetes Order II. Incertae sedis bacterium]|nr:2-oxo acid dehydrogenase subunit E2 [Bacteroidetes Order II. bacterium]